MNLTCASGERYPSLKEVFESPCHFRLPPQNVIPIRLTFSELMETDLHFELRYELGLRYSSGTFVLFLQDDFSLNPRKILLTGETDLSVQVPTSLSRLGLNIIGLHFYTNNWDIFASVIEWISSGAAPQCASLSMEPPIPQRGIFWAPLLKKSRIRELSLGVVDIQDINELLLVQETMLVPVENDLWSLNLSMPLSWEEMDSLSKLLVSNKSLKCLKFALPEGDPPVGLVLSPGSCRSLEILGNNEAGAATVNDMTRNAVELNVSLLGANLDSPLPYLQSFTCISSAVDPSVLLNSQNLVQLSWRGGTDEDCFKLWKISSQLPSLLKLRLPLPSEFTTSFGLFGKTRLNLTVSQMEETWARASILVLKQIESIHITYHDNIPLSFLQDLAISPTLSELYIAGTVRSMSVVSFLNILKAILSNPNLITFDLSALHLPEPATWLGDFVTIINNFAQSTYAFTKFGPPATENTLCWNALIRTKSNLQFQAALPWDMPYITSLDLPDIIPNSEIGYETEITYPLPSRSGKYARDILGEQSHKNELSIRGKRSRE